MLNWAIPVTAFIWEEALLSQDLSFLHKTMFPHFLAFLLMRKDKHSPPPKHTQGT